MSDATKNCPVCGETILAVARKCRFCGEYLDPSLRPHAPAPDAVDRMLMPVGRAPSAIAAGYLGLFSLFPLVGILPGLLAIVFGILAFKKINQDPSLSGRGRAWFGIITGTLSVILWSVMIIALIIDVGSNPVRWN